MPMAAKESSHLSYLEPASRCAARAAGVSELMEASLGAVLQLAVARLKQQAA